MNGLESDGFAEVVDTSFSLPLSLDAGEVDLVDVVALAGSGDFDGESFKPRGDPSVSTIFLTKLSDDVDEEAAVALEEDVSLLAGADDDDAEALFGRFFRPTPPTFTPLPELLELPPVPVPGLAYGLN